MAPADPLVVQLSPEECVFRGTVEENQEEADKAAISDALTEEGQTAKDIAEAIGRPVGTTRRRLESMREAGLVTRDGEGKRASPFSYSKVSFHQNIPLRNESNPKPNGQDSEGFDWGSGEQGK